MRPAVRNRHQLAQASKGGDSSSRTIHWKRCYQMTCSTVSAIRKTQDRDRMQSFTLSTATAVSAVGTAPVATPIVTFYVKRSAHESAIKDSKTHLEVREGGWQNGSHENVRQTFGCKVKASPGYPLARHREAGDGYTASFYDKCERVAGIHIAAEVLVKGSQSPETQEAA